MKKDYSESNFSPIIMSEEHINKYMPEFSPSKSLSLSLCSIANLSYSLLLAMESNDIEEVEKLYMRLRETWSSLAEHSHTAQEFMEHKKKIQTSFLSYLELKLDGKV